MKHFCLIIALTACFSVRGFSQEYKKHPDLKLPDTLLRKHPPIYFDSLKTFRFHFDRPLLRKNRMPVYRPPEIPFMPNARIPDTIHYHMQLAPLLRRNRQ